MKASVRGQSSRPSTGYKAGSAATHPRLSIYDQPPDFEISIDEFEEAALDRLYVLKYLEVLRARNATPDETASKLEETLRGLEADGYGGHTRTHTRGVACGTSAHQVTIVPGNRTLGCHKSERVFHNVFRLEVQLERWRLADSKRQSLADSEVERRGSARLSRFDSALPVIDLLWDGHLK